MSNQQAFDFAPTEPSEPLTLRERAEQWMSENPAIMQLFETFALRAVERRKRFGISQLAEVIRWQVNVESYGNEDYKINNSFRSFVARRLIQDHPEIEEFIETRKLLSEE